MANIDNDSKRGITAQARYEGTAIDRVIITLDKATARALKKHGNH